MSAPARACAAVPVEGICLPVLHIYNPPMPNPRVTRWIQLTGAALGLCGALVIAVAAFQSGPFIWDGPTEGPFIEDPPSKLKLFGTPLVLLGNVVFFWGMRRAVVALRAESTAT